MLLLLYMPAVSFFKILPEKFLFASRSGPTFCQSKQFAKVNYPVSADDKSHF